MKNKALHISQNELWTSSEKAVRGFTNSMFHGFFRDEDVQDMTVETATRLWRRLDAYDPTRGELDAWVWVIARNVVFTQAGRLKRERQRFTSLDDAAPEAWERLDERLGLDRPADAQLLENEAEESLTAQVPAGRSRAILGYLLEGLDDGEIADRLGISKAAAYTAICRVRKEVRRAA